MGSTGRRDSSTAGALIAGGVIVAATVLLATGLAAAAGVDRFTGPQLLTVSALLAAGGQVAGRRAGEAGILHGLLAGLLGVALAAGLLILWQQYRPSGAVTALMARGVLLLLVVGGFWGALGGLFADLRRVVRRRRAARPRVKANGGPTGGG